MCSLSIEDDASPFRDAVFADENDTNPSNMRYGENGCPEFSDTGSDLLNLSQMVRGSDPSNICDRILSSSSVRDISDLFVLTFVTRNIRGGKGEKDLSYTMFLRIWKHYPETAKKLLPLFAKHYGYWKDFLLLAEKFKKFEAESEKEAQDQSEALLKASIEIMRTQLKSDLNVAADYEEKRKSKENNVEVHTLSDRDVVPNISLVSKWLPRENSHFDKSLGFLKAFLQLDSKEQSREVKGWECRSQKDYRKQVAKLSSYLSLPEVLLSAHRADEINFHKMASRATLKLSSALLNETKNGGVRLPNDKKRKRCAELFINHIVENGSKGAALMPDEIVAEILRGNVSSARAKVLDAQWKDLWNNVLLQVETKAKEEGLDFSPSKMVPLSDVSGSMYGKPMEVSIAMGIGVSEITHPAFRNMVLTFESIPQWHKLKSDDSIVNKVRSLAGASWGGNTDFEAAYDKMIEVCIEHRIPKEDVPSLIVFSDMQFDLAARNPFSEPMKKMVPMHDVIRSKFAKAAQQLGWEDSEPTPIVYWNIRDTGGHPVEKDTEGTVLLAGFSPSLLKSVMNGEALEDNEVEVVEADGTVRKEKIRVTPSEVLRKTLNDSLYDPVREILATSTEGVLKDYNVLDTSSIALTTKPEVTNDDYVFF